MEKYQRMKVLGKGSFGSAILIKRKADGLLFVVKEVSFVKMSKKERDEARHECTMLQQLQHPNIVRYVEQFENRNNLYIVMEYCDGGDLAGKVKQARGPMKESSILYYFSQICLAMEYLHARHILHRDIKTMNVFLMKNGAVKLGDFGISTVLRNTMGMANTVCGTPYYFSPELCRNRPYNNKSDIWALGVLLYECATGGRHPFDGASMNQLMQRIVKGNYAPLSSQYSSDFRKMVDWCLQKEPARRPSIKQTLALPLMRQALEQLEENLMLATQCRVRLKDIIDFESGMEQAERPKSPQPSQVPSQVPSPRPAEKEGGISPGQAAALALARRPSALPSASPSSASPVSSPHHGGGGGAPAAVVGPKPSAGGGAATPPNKGAAAPNRGYDVHRFYSPYQRRLDGNPIVAAAAAGHAGGNRAGAPPTPSPPQPPQPHQPSDEISPRVQSPRSNMNLNNDNNNNRDLNGAGAGGAAAAADPFHADMRRVEAIIAKYGRNTDERAKETIHAYMRRKQEAYLKKQKEELESRERRNELRQRELRRVLENQRVAISPANGNKNNNNHGNSPRSTDEANGRDANRSPSRRRGSPQFRAKSEDISPRSRSPVSSPLRAGAGAAGARRSPTSPGGPASGAFGRDPRRNGGWQHQPQPRSRPTTPQHQHAPTAQRTGNAAVVTPKPSGNGPSRKVVYAANSPQPGQIDQRTDAAEARRETGSEPPRPQSPSRQPRRSAEAINIDWRSLGSPKLAYTPPRRKKVSLSAGLDGGIGGHRMVLQPAQPTQARRSQEGGHPAAAQRGVEEELPRPSILAPLGNEAHGNRSPRRAAPALSNDVLDGGDGNGAAPDSVSPCAVVGGDARLQRPNRVHQGYLKPLNGRGGDDHLSPARSPMSGLSPRPDALPSTSERRLAGASPANSPHAQAAAAHPLNGRSASPPAELVDIPRSVVAAAAAASPAAPVSAANGPVEEALQILRRRRQQTGTTTEVKDLPALNLISSELGGAHRHHNHPNPNEAVGYVGMSREAVSHDDERFLAEQQQRHRSTTKENAIPNTLEALRSLRETSDEAAAAAAPPLSKGGPSAGAVYPVGQLALLKQRQRMQHSGAPSSAGGGSAPSSVSHNADGAWPSAQSEPAAHEEKQRPYTSRSSPSITSQTQAQVKALSLGDVSRAAPHSDSPSASPKVGGGAPQSPMDGYAEMLQHLKDLLQRRRVTRAVSSNASTPTANAASPQPAAAAAVDGSPSHGPQRRFPLPPPLDSLPSSGGDGACTDLVMLSPPKLNSTKPLHPSRPEPPALDALPSSDDQAEEDEDDDFEDAVPLSPVRCTELNDTYARQQEQKKGAGRAVPDDVYTDDVDLTSANMEEELDGEEGYTGYYKLPSPQELLKGN